MHKFTLHSIALAVVLFSVTSMSHSAVVESWVGDRDQLGGACAVADYCQDTTFDNRSPSEASATNGAQITDIAPPTTDPDDDPDLTWGIEVELAIFSHEFPAFSSITSASLTLGLGGIESGPGNDPIYVNGILVDQGVAPVYPNPTYWFNEFTFTLAPEVLDTLLNGTAEVVISLNCPASNAICGPDFGVGEPAFYDFSLLTIEGELRPVPLPPALYLFGTGLLGLIGISRRRKAA